MSDLAEWYDRNTRVFLTVGRGAEAGGLHRELWGPGVTDVVGAVQHVNDLILAHVAALGVDAPHLVDLGCGVGGALVYLLSRTPGTGVGITLSGAQVTLARARVAAADLTARVQIAQGDFTHPPDVGPADLAFSCEAFVHGPDPAGTFLAARRLLRPGGLLVLVDDFLTRPIDALGPGEQATVARFVDGWRLGSLILPDRAQTLADAAGLDLVSDRDLTPLLRLGRPRDRWVALWVRLLGQLPITHPYWQSLVGGDALQTCLATGLVTYRMLVFRVRSPHQDPGGGS